MLFLLFVQDVTHIAEGKRPRVGINVLDYGLSLAGFEVIIDGRFWVITEDFEKARLGPIARLSECSWFADAKPIARKLAEASIRSDITNMIAYYRYAETLLGGH